MRGFGGELVSAVMAVSKLLVGTGRGIAPTADLAPADCAIDVSHYQGKIDWPSIPPEITIVMLKATEGTYFIDPMFKSNQIGAELTGRRVIPYHFCTTDDPHDQAKYFLDVAGLGVGDPYGLDWETYGNFSEITVNVHRIGFDLMEHIDRLPLGYWGVYPPGAPDAFMKSWPWWVPRYPMPNDGNVPSRMMKGGWTFWQYTDRGVIPGVPELVDRSLFNGTAAEAIDWFENGK